MNLAALELEAGEVLEVFLRETDVPGVAVGLVGPHGLATAARGVASVDEPSVPMTPGTVAPVYSLSKVMTATAVALLADRGLLELDVPVVRYLLDQPDADPLRGATLRHLLSHTSGLVHGPVPVVAPVSSSDPLEHYVLGGCVHAAHVAEPGEVFGYSDLGIVIAGYVLQRRGGRPFDAVMGETLFAPAAMRRTTTDPLVAMTWPMSQQHVRDRSGGLNVRHVVDFPPVRRPSSGVFSSAEDLARFAAAHVRADAPRLLPDSVIDVLQAPVADVGLDIVRAFGLTLTVGPWYGDELSRGHEGYQDGGWCKLLLLPEQGVGVVWIDNTGVDARLEEARQDSFDQLLGLLGAGPRSSRRPAGGFVDPTMQGRVDPARAAGVYRRPAGRPLRVEAEGARLRVSDGVRSALYEPVSGRVHVALTETPDQLPWAPDKDSTRSALSLAGPPEEPTHLLMNGLPYRRQPQEHDA